MDYYGHYQRRANNNIFALPSAFSVSPSSAYNPNASLEYFSEGLVPAFDHFQYDPFLTPNDQTYNCMLVNDGFDIYDPLYSSLQLPYCDNSPLSSPSPIQVICGKPSFESSESIGRELFGSSWSDALVTNGFDTSEPLLHHEIPHPVKVISENDIKECETIPSVQHVVKPEQEEPCGQTWRARKRSARQMSECDSNGSSNNNSVADTLTWEILSQYFYMPIALAARELNIGLTLFKKRCRDLGVRRWPHRKLMSIQSLINLVKELENDGVDNQALSIGMVRNAIEVLENQKMMMEVMPDIELEPQTKRLRQACFKANYKKRRLMIMHGDGLETSSGSISGSHQGNESNVDNIVTDHGGQDFEESDELRSLLFDSISPGDCTFLK